MSQNQRPRLLTAALGIIAISVFACGGSKGSSGPGPRGDGGNAGDGANVGDGGTATFTSFEPAETVIGQADFMSYAQATTPSAATTDSPVGSAAFDGTQLFLPDTYTNRVLGFLPVPNANGASATFVLGQASASTNMAGTTATTLYLPETLHTDGTTLAVADSGNHRVLLVPSAMGGSTSSPIVLGWSDLATPSSGCSATLLQSPASALVVAGKLLVADRGNNRVLIWNTVPTANGAAADLVLGQGTFTGCVNNDSLQNGTTGLRSAATLFGPTDVWSDGTRVAVADRSNNRVLVWSTFPTQSGVPADLVVGQTDFTLARDDATATVLLQPAAIASSGGRLLVADSGHNRVLGWNSWPAANGTAADFVLGQGSFTKVAPNDDEQTGAAGSGPTARTLDYPTGVAFAGSALVVSDALNRRFLVFRSQ